MAWTLRVHYSDVTMIMMASQITSIMIVYSTVYSGPDQRKHQSSASLPFVWGIHRWPVNSPHKGQWRGKCFHLMTSSGTGPLKGDPLATSAFLSRKSSNAKLGKFRYVIQNMLLNKQSIWQCVETYWSSCDATITYQLKQYGIPLYQNETYVVI